MQGLAWDWAPASFPAKASGVTHGCNDKLVERLPPGVFGSVFL
jgi:hypothetical protein